MKLTNRYGTPVDPVPFLVVSALGFTISYSYGPLYFAAFGFAIAEGVVISTAVFLAVTAAAFYRYVWTHRPEFAAEIPAHLRFRRLVYGAVIGMLLVVLLSLPLFVR
ncbi:hypothetical protein ACFQH6_20060 [Halobacteriaceae archaeon GCM10025711]